MAKILRYNYYSPLTAMDMWLAVYLLVGATTIAVSECNPGKGDHVRMSARASTHAASRFARQDCAAISSQLEAILGPCTRSLQTCLATAQPEDALVPLLCDEEESLFFWRETVACRGEDFADDLWTTACSDVKDLKCYELVESNLQLVNDTFEECCDSTTCSGSCKAILQDLSDALRCCVNTVLLKLPFDNCSLTEDNTRSTAKSQLEAAFTACNVDFPNHCEHLFTDLQDLGPLNVSTTEGRLQGQVGCSLQITCSAIAESLQWRMLGSRDPLTSSGTRQVITRLNRTSMQWRSDVFFEPIAFEHQGAYTCTITHTTMPTTVLTVQLVVNSAPLEVYPIENQNIARQVSHTINCSVATCSEDVRVVLLKGEELVQEGVLVSYSEELQVYRFVLTVDRGTPGTYTCKADIGNNTCSDMQVFNITAPLKVYPIENQNIARQVSHSINCSVATCSEDVRVVLLKGQELVQEGVLVSYSEELQVYTFVLTVDRGTPGTYTCKADIDNNTYSDMQVFNITVSDFGCNEGSVRLVGLTNPPVGVNTSTAGIVEVCHNVVWGTVCSESNIMWSQKNAQVACRSAGFSGALNVILPSTIAPNIHQMSQNDSIHYKNVVCNGSESSLQQCSVSTNITGCDHAQDVAITCQPATEDAPLGGDVRLIGDVRDGVGAVEYYSSMYGWTGICADSDHDSSWESNTAAARVVCRQLGYEGGRAFVESVSASAILQRRIVDVSCDEQTDFTLDECSSDAIAACNSLDAGWVECQLSDLEDYSVRLVGSSREGLVEVVVNGRWGQICSENWNVNEVEVVCNELELRLEDGYGVTPNGTYVEYLSSTKPYWITDVECSSTDDAIKECGFGQPTGYTACSGGTTTFSSAQANCGTCQVDCDSGGGGLKAEVITAIVSSAVAVLYAF